MALILGLSQAHEEELIAFEKLDATQLRAHIKEYIDDVASGVAVQELGMDYPVAKMGDNVADKDAADAEIVARELSDNSTNSTQAGGGTEVTRQVVQTIDMEITIDDVSNFDVNVFKEQLVKAGGLNADEVTIDKVEFIVKAKFSFSEAVSEEECAEAIAKANSVDVAQVTCTIARRLSPETRSARQLQTAVSVEAEIKTDNAADVAGIKESVTNGTKLAAALTETTGKTVQPRVTEQPNTVVTVITKVATPVTEDGAGGSTEPQPLSFDSEALASIGSAVGGTVEVQSISAVIEEGTVTEAPTECTCLNGEAATGSSCTADGTEVCAKCNDGFELNDAGVCKASNKKRGTDDLDDPDDDAVASAPPQVLPLAAMAVAALLYATGA